MKHKPGRDPRRLPNQDEIRKTTEPLDQPAGDMPTNAEAIKQPVKPRPDRPTQRQ
jgi:hypothetical protein